ncbi:MAG: hypothetical protein ACTTJW_00435 [Sphaerochaeta sp.]
MNPEGRSDIIAAEVMGNESGEAYLKSVNNLKAGGVEKVWLYLIHRRQTQWSVLHKIGGFNYINILSIKVGLYDSLYW